MSKVNNFFFKKRKINAKVLVCILVFLAIFTPYVAIDNYSLDIETLSIKSAKIPYEFDGYKIAHISDFHNRESLKFQDKVTTALREAEPDIIVITGDIIDKQRTNTKTALLFAGELTTIAPVYYVRGNHEVTVQRNYPILYTDFINKLEALGVRILNNECVAIQISPSAKINVFGLEELYVSSDYLTNNSAVADNYCRELNVNKEEFNILLAHHPEQFSVYSKYGFDAVFSGHAHGGQFRIFGQGISAPDQGFFPEFTGGLYEQDGTQMILSRGLGNSTFPFRLFNKPHLIIAELKVIY